jgi:hypothetical protein
MWTFEIKTGRVLRDGKEIGKGYSGYDDGDGIAEPGEGKNDPTKQAVKGVGPVPEGLWVFGAPFFHDHAGPYVLRLLPKSVPQLYGRSGFLIHGDSMRLPGSASHGCIILARDLRMKLWESGDHEIRVVSGAATNSQKENIA